MSFGWLAIVFADGAFRRLIPETALHIPLQTSRTDQPKHAELAASRGSYLIEKIRARRRFFVS